MAPNPQAPPFFQLIDHIRLGTLRLQPQRIPAKIDLIGAVRLFREMELRAKARQRIIAILCLGEIESKPVAHVTRYGSAHLLRRKGFVNTLRKNDRAIVSRRQSLLQRAAPAHGPESIVDFYSECAKSQARNTFRAEHFRRPEHVEKGVSTCDRFDDVPGYVRRVRPTEITGPVHEVYIQFSVCKVSAFTLHIKSCM